MEAYLHIRTLQRLLNLPWFSSSMVIHVFHQQLYCIRFDVREFDFAAIVVSHRRLNQPGNYCGFARYRERFTLFGDYIEIYLIASVYILWG